MSVLARNLIRLAQDECARRLEAIEASHSKITEAETLTATLCTHGLQATTHGYSSSYAHDSTKVDTWAQAMGNSGAEILAAIGAAGLRIADIKKKDGDGVGWVYLEGLETTLAISESAATDMLGTLLRTMQPIAEGFVHA